MSGNAPSVRIATDELMDLMDATNNLEAIGDLIETNLVSLGRARLANGYRVGPGADS